MGICNSTNKEIKVNPAEIEEKKTVRNEYFPMGKSIMMSKHENDEL